MDVFFMAIAVSMDAFSVSIGIGTRKFRLKHIIKLSFAVGVAHIISPLIGMLCAQILSRYVSRFATMLGGGLLTLMGIHMIFSAFINKKDDLQPIPIRCLSILIFAFSVSIDAMSIGFTLGLFSVNTWLTIVLFGFWGMTMTFIGFLVGRRVGYWLGSYGEVIGGIILFVIGYKIMF